MIKKRDIKILGICFGVVFLALIGRLLYIQIIEGKDLSAMAEAQHSHTGNLSELNYLVLDATGKNLLKTEDKYRIVIDTVDFKRNNSSTPMEELYAFRYTLKNYNKNYDVSVDLSSPNEGKRYYDVDKETYDKINSLNSINGVYSYKYNSIDRKSSWDICNMLISTKTRDGKDKEGDCLENTIADYTSSNKNATIVFSTDSQGKVQDGVYNIPKDNVNLKLTIDTLMEGKVKEVLDQDKYKKYSQIGVALCDSDTGKIRVLTQKDYTKPNVMLASTTENGYSPGSIFKTIVLEAALNEGIVSLGDKFTCECKPNLPCKTSHGTLTVEEAFTRSCNNIFAEIGNKLGSDKIIEYAKAQGFFSKVLNLYGDNEAQGDYVISDVDKGGATNISIGQNMRIEPLQALGMINTVVNNGVYVKPYIVESLEDNDFNTVNTFESPKKQQIVKSSVATIVKNEFLRVVKDDNGTGKAAYLKNVELGGKTGTATRMEPKKDDNGEYLKDEKGNSVMEKRYDGWFVGYYKYKGKNYSMVVFVEDIANEESGGTIAAPIFKEIVEKVTDIK
ncbi:MAG: penicillin-binding protein 2 [Clostridium sp.]|uniref:peptidoglycan D,D-transpeptidase FtsI family protein n=1 Tax=Clostridium sp. TaxID=1506 RepID=UPI002A89D374|nr:penicillin-binding protein 2 [Clostridium sp.]MDY5098085.1 penicillin-binding transpeptidase domain-containing protein [Clostridium sp.]